jgi:HEAT repeat protein
MEMVRPLLTGLLLALLAVPALADDATPPVDEKARAEAIDSIRKDLRRMASGPRAAKEKPDILKALESLESLGGPDAAKAALEALPLVDEEVRTRLFAFVEKEHPKSLVKPLAELLEDKRYRRDFDARRRIAHAFAVIADRAAIGPLTDLIQGEDASVVAAAADALATFVSAPHKDRVEPVKRLIDLYESTWNLMNSIRPEDKVISGVMRERWEIYGKSVRAALQALAGRQDLTRPHEWRRWWNDHKKREDW